MEEVQKMKASEGDSKLKRDSGRRLSKGKGFIRIT